MEERLLLVVDVPHQWGLGADVEQLHDLTAAATVHG